MDKKKVDEVEVLDHGIDGSQYFPGCGVSWTDFEDCYTGCGSNAQEAFDDCLEQVAQCGVYESEDVEAKALENIGFKKVDDIPTKPNTDKYYDENEDSDMYYYLSIRVK